MGRVIMSGIVPTLKAPVTGVLASSLAVGSTVKLMEGGTAVGNIWWSTKESPAIPACMTQAVMGRGC